MVDIQIDYESHFQNKLNNLLVTASWVEEAQKLIGIQAVSQIWGEKPAWYIWISGAPGVYQLELTETTTDRRYQESGKGFFSVKCYPYPESDIFKTFSVEEQKLRQSPLFDQTNTPRFDSRNFIPDTFFNVAAIEFTLNLDDTRACFTLESLSTMRITNESERIRENKFTIKPKESAGGKISRSVPGWRLGYPLFDRLLSLYTLYSKVRPVRFRVTRSPGFEYTYTKANLLECIPAGDIFCYTASSFYEQSCGQDGHFDFRAEKQQEYDAEVKDSEVLFDQRFDCGHFHSFGQGPRAELPEAVSINPLWWSLAEADYKSELASTCGCSSD